MREVHRPHFLVVQILDWEVGEHASVCEVDPFQVDFLPCVLVVNVVLPPLLSPFLGFEGNREGTSHLHSIADWHLGSSFVVEESQGVVLQVDRGARELNSGDFIKILEVDSCSPVLLADLLGMLGIIVFFEFLQKLHGDLS